MVAAITDMRFAGALAARLAARPAPGEVVLHWLGQAGFVLQAGGRRLVIDPYLSDTLTAKYRHTATPHERMMSAPVDVEGLGPVDLVLVTHQHTDHMDPGTLAPLARLNPNLRFVVPRASLAEAMRRIDVPAARLVALDAGERFSPWPGFTVTALRAAHETLERDAAGHHRFLGYGMHLDDAEGAVTLVHSGDTVPFVGQVAELKALRPDLVLLPVNGRSAELLARGVPGNLTLEEAIDLTAQVGAGAMVAHHHGMFAMNTVPLATIDAKAADPDLPIHLIPARLGLEVRLRPRQGAARASPCDDERIER